MEQLAARVFDVAGRQVQILAAALDSTQGPRTLNPDGSLRTSDYKWWCSGFFPGTLEEKIDAMIKDKQALADSLFADGGEKLVTEMSDDELMELVKLDASAVEK